jgi:nitrile hydratase accessory protein
MSGDGATRTLSAALTGASAPPRRNGELVFCAPWHGRAFGMVVSLHRAGRFEWDEFRQCLIARIGARDRHHAADAGYDYYAHWLGAVQDLLVGKGLADPGELEILAHAIARRPPEAEHHRAAHAHPG